MIKLKFLFDLGGVFFDWNPEYFYKKIFSSSKKMQYFLKEVCNDEWNIKQDCGRLIEKAENELILKFPDYEKEIKMYYPNHRKMIKNTFKSSISVLKELKSKNYLCYVLSNWSSETFVGMRDDYPFLNYFDGLLISGEEKLVKPDKKIYELALKKFNLIPEQTIFIDDKFENIEAAKNLNFQTIHIKNPKKIQKEIKKFFS